ncbi:copper chaperone PCu(A)C [Corynebacterium freneyi]|uniref:copper chaperone PCu(A)C n=1 Tax=Corynebacterium freneyi TaxID=134034 RepID=UPI00254EF3F8|nr:copper chaperone PCu(A)C [Corynebacterium freneyi]MDK8767024.1 copper chaperone PCu(A)C [Corynebacterium freneyi]
MKLHRTTKALVAGSAALALALAGCSSDDAADTTAANGSATTTAADGTESEASAAVTFEDAYIKEKPADKSMTGIFGTLKNNTDEDLEVVDFRVEGLKEGTVFEQHATEDGKMFKIEGGHTIPANGEKVLAPGDDHLMIMDNDEALEPGQMFTVVLELSDGSTLTQELEVRVQAAGEEDYGEDGELGNPGMGEDGHMTNMNDGMDDEHDEHAGH